MCVCCLLSLFCARLMSVVCCVMRGAPWLFVVRCLRFVVRCVLHAVGCLCLWCAVCCLLFGVCVCVVYCLLRVMSDVCYVLRSWLRVACCLLCAGGCVVRCSLCCLLCVGSCVLSVDCCVYIVCSWMLFVVCCSRCVWLAVIVVR